MGSRHLDPFSAAGTRNRQRQDAVDMQQIVAQRANRAGTEPPPYEFLELIGKGSFGRVYKCRHTKLRRLMAVKIVDVDELDYKLDHNIRDMAVADFIKEVNALKQIKDSNPRNINTIHEAFDLHSQLWIVSDYCSGGSVHTLMKARSEPGLEEHYIIPIARELAVAIKHVHDAGIIHRDVKCGNVLIDENGNLQLCDFGIAAAMESDGSKRSTIIGTPYWMAPEMHLDGLDQGYGRDVDCWAYGCTIFEMATGMPPYHKFHPRYLGEVLKSAPRLEEEDKYSEGLRDFVAFCLQDKPEDRPTAKQILEHPYIANTELHYPTSSLRDLIDRYVRWETRGGQRMSLFNAMGAAAPQLSGQQDPEDNWIFSTTDDFERGYEQRYSTVLNGIADIDFAEGTAAMDLPAVVNLPRGPSRNLTPLEAAKEEQKAQRGENSLARLFDADKNPYDYEGAKIEDDDQPMSDLPLRNMSNDRAANRETLIDLDTSGLDMPPTFNFDFNDITTLKANRKSSMPSVGDSSEGEHQSAQVPGPKRATKDWKFPSFNLSVNDEDSDGLKLPAFAEEEPDETNRANNWRLPSETHSNKLSLDNENRRTMDWTFSTAVPIMDTESDPEAGHASRPMLEAPFKPSLHRMATEPPGMMSTNRQFSAEFGPAGGRDSNATIDLNFGQGHQTSFDFDQHVHGLPRSDSARPISPVSATQSLTSMGPFDLDNDVEARRNKYPQRRMAGPNGSLSVAERRMSRLHKGSKSSFGSQLLTSRARGDSVDSTASSFVDEGSDESIFGRQYNRSMTAKMRDQFRVTLERSVSIDKRHSRNLTDDSYEETDTDGPYPINPHHQRFSKNTGSTAYDTDSSVQEDNKKTSLPATFPALVAPQSMTLREESDHSMLLSEFDKMLDNAQQAFAYTTMILESRESELEDEEGAAAPKPLDMML